MMSLTLHDLLPLVPIPLINLGPAQTRTLRQRMYFLLAPSLFFVKLVQQNLILILVLPQPPTIPALLVEFPTLELGILAQLVVVDHFGAWAILLLRTLPLS